jgi:hypothetical protein
VEPYINVACSLRDEVTWNIVIQIFFRANEMMSFVEINSKEVEIITDIVNSDNVAMLNYPEFISRVERPSLGLFVFIIQDVICLDEHWEE